MHPGEKIDGNEVAFGLNLSINNFTLQLVAIMCRDWVDPLKHDYYSEQRVALYYI